MIRNGRKYAPYVENETSVSNEELIEEKDESNEENNDNEKEVRKEPLAVLENLEKEGENEKPSDKSQVVEDKKDENENGHSRHCSFVR